MLSTAGICEDGKHFRGFPRHKGTRSHVNGFPGVESEVESGTEVDAEFADVEAIVGVEPQKSVVEFADVMKRVFVGESFKGYG